VNAIENPRRGPGNTPIDLDELAQLIPNLATKGELDEWERTNIIEARRWAFAPKVLRAREPLDEGYLRDLHTRMFDQTWRWAGQYRRTEKNIGCGVALIVERIGALIGDARYWVQHSTYSQDEIAIRFHHRLVGAIHPFPNGNGRHARLYADVISVKLGGTEFTWGQNVASGGGAADAAAEGDVVAVRGAYLAALVAADGGNIEPLLRFARS
jgi:Fic-DOC domain mobile mystery protein B